MKLLSIFSRLLFYASRSLAIIEFVVMVFCISQAIDTGENLWWKHVFINGVLWIFSWNFATFIRKIIPW